MQPREEEKEEKEKQDKEKQEEKKESESKEDDYRARYRSFEEVRKTICPKYLQLFSFLRFYLYYINLKLVFLTKNVYIFFFLGTFQKYRSTSATTTASSTLPSSSSSTSSLYSTSSLNRPNSLTGLTSSYSRSTREAERGITQYFPECCNWMVVEWRGTGREMSYLGLLQCWVWRGRQELPAGWLN